MKKSLYFVMVSALFFSGCIKHDVGAVEELTYVPQSLTFIEYEIKKSSPSKEELENTINILQIRLKNLGYINARVMEMGDKIRVSIPDFEEDAESMSQVIGQTAQLTFVDCEGNVVLEESDIKNAQYKYGSAMANGTDEHHIVLTLTDEGIHKFFEATGRIAKLPAGDNVIFVMLDSEAIQSATVMSQIDSGEIIVVGSMNEKKAKTVAELIRSGQLPLDIEVITITKEEK